MAHRNAMLLIATVLVPALTLVAQPVDGQRASPCVRCKPKTALWPWKANGYAVGSSVETAETAAKRAAIDQACVQSKKYLAPRKLTCRPGCTSGEITEHCDESKPPQCLTGTHASNAGMWQFVCRKMHGKQAPGKCGEDAAQEQPGYGMCDVSVTAKKARACTSPDCDQDSPR